MTDEEDPGPWSDSEELPRDVEPVQRGQADVEQNQFGPLDRYLQ